MSDIVEEYRQKKLAKVCKEARKLCAESSFAAPACSVVAHCVFCKESLTRPGGNKWWIAGSHHGDGLCYDCILAGMRVIMAGVTYAQDHGNEIEETPPQNNQAH